MTTEPPQKERIAKRMARAGLCSRREAERWIEAGRVTVNGMLLESAAFTVAPEDNITVDGKAIPALERPRLWRYHKPPGLVTSHKDEKGRDTVFDKLPEELPRVISVGRLDLNSEGLLLLTNDGELARKLELPATGWKRKYRVRVHGHPRESDMQKLAKGITVEGVRYGTIDGTIDSTKGANSWLTIALREGKNREIRKVMEYLGYSVSRLIRTSYGPMSLGDLPAGAVDEVRSKILREQMGVEKFEDQAATANTGQRAPRGKRQGALKPKANSPRPTTAPRKQGTLKARSSPKKSS